jgi:Protein of unknown function (DUF3014)
MSEKNRDWFLPASLGAGALLIAGGIGLYYLRDEAPVPEPVAVVAPPAETPTTTTPPPVATTTTPPALPLPTLDESDTDLLGGLTEVFGQEAIGQFLVPERIVRNIVVTIDNLPRQQVALNQRPIKPTPGEFITAGPEDAPVLAPENYERYEPFVALVRTVDAKTLVALYRGLQPLFQQAYEELGHPNEAFNNRLIEVIEHLLATPNVRDEIRLVQPSVLYRHADERLEKLSSGQKLLIRMGPGNTATIKAKLREIQAELV